MGWGGPATTDGGPALHILYGARHVMTMRNTCDPVNGRKNMTAQITSGNFQLSETQPGIHTHRHWVAQLNKSSTEQISTHTVLWTFAHLLNKDLKSHTVCCTQTWDAEMKDISVFFSLFMLPALLNYKDNIYTGMHIWDVDCEVHPIHHTVGTTHTHTCTYCPYRDDKLPYWPLLGSRNHTANQIWFMIDSLTSSFSLQREREIIFTENTHKHTQTVYIQLHTIKKYLKKL